MQALSYLYTTERPLCVGHDSAALSCMSTLQWHPFASAEHQELKLNHLKKACWEAEYGLLCRWSGAYVSDIQEY